jgi:hypothetical protein
MSEDREQQTITSADVGTITLSKAPRADALRAELEAEEARLLAILEPAREYYEQHCNDSKYLAAKRLIKEVNAALGPVRNELAALARAKGSNGIKVEPGEFSAE